MLRLLTKDGDPDPTSTQADEGDGAPSDAPSSLEVSEREAGPGEVVVVLCYEISVFAVSRFMGSSIAMIDRRYGHLARDSREHAVSLLDALAIERAVDVGWTSHREGAGTSL
jgi:hypothetical protein